MKPFPRLFLFPWGLGILAVLIALLVGCGSKEKDRKAVSGTVTFKGAPLNNATIRFLPAAESTATSQATASIDDGKYELPASQGLMPGKYQVSILSQKPLRGPQGGKRKTPGASKSKQREIIPERFNAKTTLECEVTPDGPNSFNFDLK
jgi:hypothetical protein